MKIQLEVTLLVLSSLLLISCAKEKEYDTVYKEPEIQRKSDFLTKNPDGTPVQYLYVPMTLGTPRQVAEANPFYQGQEKLVKLDFTERGLEVHEIEPDDRFADNELNHVPVLLIPGQYKQFKCREDEYGKCTNREIEDNELTWDKKNYFLPNYAGLTVKEVNMLDLANVEGDSCVSNVATRLVDYTIQQDGVVNIELEKTYKLSKSWQCIRDNYFNDKLSYNSFKVRFFYSLVKLEKLASADYEKLEYPIPDQDVYGLFKSQESKLGDDFDSQRARQTFLANRWNPKKKVLTYYLSKSFNKPENKVILEATQKSIEVINKNLQSAEVPFTIELIQQKETDNISPGDLRYNSIVLIDDPLANGLLGYAPTVKNPITGEIVQGHVNMYGGVLKSGTRWAYEAAVDIMEAELKEKSESKIDPSISIAKEALASFSIPEVLVADNLVSTASNEKAQKAVGRILKQELSRKKDLNHNAMAKVAKVSKTDLKQKLSRKMQEKFDFKARFNQLKSGNFEGFNELEKQIALADADEHGHKFITEHSPEFFPIAGTTKAVYPGLLKIKNILDKRGVLKRWSKLTDAQQEEVKNVILVNRYTSTFVHEMGHALGLRHNFAGSTDADNFYTDAEAQALGMTKAPAYSSVMDYAFSEYNELGSFGKYDVAALKFSYARKMQTRNGLGVKIPESHAGLKKIKSEHNDKIEKQIVAIANTRYGIESEDFDEIEKILKSALNNPQLQEEVKADVRNTLKILDNQIVDFAYCTDENASLSSTCNRFDEGSTLVEIAKHSAQKYNNWYKYRNFRDERLNFSANDMAGYIIGRYREFGQIRDIMEDYEFFAGIFGKEVMSNGCGPAELEKYPVCKQINDRVEAVEIVGDFFIDILKTPDHTCALAKAEEPNKIVELRTLTTIYDKIKYGISKYVVTNCFEEEVKDAMAKEGLVVVGENGRFLNDVRDTNPNYKYVTDISIRGTWADKVMALRYLYQRRGRNSTTDTNHMALIDHPAIKAKVENVLQHMILGKPLANPLPFTKEDGTQFVVPYILASNVQIKQMEDHFEWFKMYLGMPLNGGANLLQTMLHQIRHTADSYDRETEKMMLSSNNYPSVIKTRGFINESLRQPLAHYHFDGRFSYQAEKINTLSYFMLDSIAKKPFLDKIGSELIANVVKMRTNPDAPEEYSEAEKIYFNLEFGFQYALINNAVAGNDLPEPVFINAFGAENGPILFKLYKEALKNKAKDLKEITDAKESIMEKAPVDASVEVKQLYEETLTLLQDYLKGGLNENVFKFYYQQLEKLPQAM
jgi:hypothetical protein